MSAVHDLATPAPAIQAVPKRALTLSMGTTILILAVLIDIWLRQEGIIGQLIDRLRRPAASRHPIPARRTAP